jgi:hypothetical protein
MEIFSIHILCSYLSSVVVEKRRVNGISITNRINYEELDGPTVSALQSAIAKVKQRWSVISWVTKNLYLEVLRAF